MIPCEIDKNFLPLVKMCEQREEHWCTAENSTPLSPQLLKMGLNLKHEDFMFPFKPFPGLMLNILYLYSCLSSFEKSSYVSSTISWNNESHCLIMDFFFSLSRLFLSH